MSGQLFIQLVLQVGLPLAKELYKMWSAPVVTDKDIERLDEIAAKSADDYFIGRPVDA